MSVNEFYANRELFLTGGSGVVGKAVIVKLLTCCNVKCIYLLTRPKHSLSVEDRLKKLRNAKNFKILRETAPHQLDKLVAIQGDALMPNLGISPEDRKRLENVSIMMHCAATIRFDEPLKWALRLNVAGTYEALKFAEDLKDLKVFIHVSTFFSNPYLKYVEPKIYPSPMDWKFCLKLLEDDIDEDMLDILTKKMIVGFPNTYTFTKNLAESVVNDFRHRVPAIIYRPSIVVFSISDPEPGFPSSLVGAMGLFALVGAGILKTVYIGKDIILDMTPQDTGVKAMLYYGMKGADIYQQGVPESALTYQTATTRLSPHSFRKLGNLMDDSNVWYDTAYEKNFLLPGCVYTASRLRYMFLVFTKEVLPALLGDCLMRLCGKKPILLSIVRKAYITLEVMKPFLFNNFDSEGPTDFEEMLNATRGSDFDLSDVYGISKSERFQLKYQRLMSSKIRQVLLNEDPSTVPKAQKIMKVKICIYNVVRAVLAFFLCRWLYRLITGYLSI